MFYFICLIITTSANYTIDLTLVKNNNAKLAQLYFIGQYIDSLQHINVTEPELQNNSNFLYQIWYNANYTAGYVLIYYPDELIDPKQYEENMFPQDDDNRQAMKNYLDGWQSQTDANKSIILQSIVQQLGKGVLGKPIQCIQIKQNKLIENNEKKKGSLEYITPVPWQHVQMTDQQYKLCKFFAKAYEKNLTIEETFDSLSDDEQEDIYETYCRFFEIPVVKKPTPPKPSNPPNPPNPQTPKQTSKKRTPLKKETVLFIMIGAVILTLTVYYIVILIERLRQRVKDSQYE